MHLRKNAFTLPEKGASQAAQEFTPALLKAFLEEIEDLLKTSYAKDAHTKKIWIRQKYEFHFEKCAEESVGKALWENMAVIYYAWQEKNKDGDFILSEERKLSYALLLEEGVPGCSEGFLDRAYLVRVSCENKFSLSHILHILRREIVEKVAAIYTDRGEVHGYNTTFKIANQLGYGVKGLQEDDYSGGVDIAAITEALIKAFDSSYSPMAIVAYLMDYLRNTMISFGYKGMREKNYEFKTFGKWVEILKQFFLEFKNISSDMEEFFLCNDDGFVIDLHWGKIQELLWEYLLTHFFVSDDETKDLVLRFFSHDNEKHCEEDFHVLMGTLIKKEEDALYLISDLQDIAHKEYCLKAFLSFSKGEIKTLFYKSLKELSFENVAQFLLTQLPPDFLSEYGGTALILAAAKQPTAVPPLLDVIGKFPEEKKAEILNTKTKDDWTALMLAARCHPSVVPLLLDAIGNLSEETQAEILGAKNINGATALILAICHQPTAVPALLDAIRNLPEEKQAEILGTKDKDGSTALVLAARYQPTVVSAVLDAIGKLSEEAQAKILSVKNKDGWTALMLAAMHHPTAVPPLLDAIGKLPEETQAAILNAKNNDGWTALMLAVRHHPTAVPFLLDAIGKLPEEAQAAILNAQNNDGWTALMLAARYQPSAVPFLVETIEKLSEEKQVEILSAKTNDGLTILMLAAGNHPTALPFLLDAIGKLPWQKQADILNVKNPDGITTLILTAGSYPTAVPPLLDAIGKLPEEAQAAILSAKADDGWTALMIAARRQPTAVPALLDAIGKLSERKQAEILCTRDISGYTAFMLATEYHPTVVPFFLRRITFLEKEHCKIFLRKTNLDINAFDDETKKMLSALDAILKGQEKDIPQALAIEGGWIKWAPEKIKRNVDIALIAIEQNPIAMEYVHDSLQQVVLFRNLAKIENGAERKNACEACKNSQEYKKLKLLYELDEYIDEVNNIALGFLQDYWYSNTLNHRPTKRNVAEKLKYLLNNPVSNEPLFTEKELMILRNTPCLREASQFLNKEAPNNIPVMVLA